MKALQKRVTNMIEAGVTLTNVIQIMLHRSLLPCQLQTTPMWSWKPEYPRSMQYFHGTTREKLWRALFQPQETWPAEAEDVGLDAEHPPKEVM